MFACSYYPEGDEGRLISCSEQAVKGLSFVCFHLEAGWQKRAFPSPPWGVFQSACFHGLWEALNSLTITCLDHRRHLQGSLGGSGSQVFQVEYQISLVFQWQLVHTQVSQWSVASGQNWFPVKNTAISHFSPLSQIWLTPANTTKLSQ